jgi:hypothetical protein
MRRSDFCWISVLGVLGCVVMGSVSPAAHGYTAIPPTTPPPWAICAGASQANLAVLEASLSPANDATVAAGSPVTFTGHSESTPTFAVASSSALMSNADIDSGTGSAQAEPASSGPPVVYSYAFTSTKATGTPGAVYWEASFSDASLSGCEGLSPTIYTTQVHTLTVLPAPMEEAAAKKNPEESATTGSVSLDEATINVQSSHQAAIKLACTGSGKCSGKLTLTAKRTIVDGPGSGEKASSATASIGSARFAISAGKTAMVKLILNATGRALLKADHGRLSSNLTILESVSAHSQTHTETVQLVQKITKAKKPTR